MDPGLISAHLAGLYEKGMFFDTVINIFGRTFKVHRVSRVFKCRVPRKALASPPLMHECASRADHPIPAFAGRPVDVGIL
jgi:hypothetical protein